MAVGALKQGGACTVQLAHDASGTPTWRTVNDVKEFTAEPEFEFFVDEMACGRDEQAGTSYKFSGRIVTVDVVHTHASTALALMEGAGVSGTADSAIKVTAKDGSTYTYSYVRIKSRHEEQVPYNENIRYVIEWETQKRDTLSDILTFAT